VELNVYRAAGLVTDKIPNGKYVAARDGVTSEGGEIIPLSRMSQCTAARSMIKLTRVVLTPWLGIAKKGRGRDKTRSDLNRDRWLQSFGQQQLINPRLKFAESLHNSNISCCNPLLFFKLLR
jgi:hypothetical protein